MANFRETQLRHIPAGAPVDIYLQSHPAGISAAPSSAWLGRAAGERHERQRVAARRTVPRLDPVAARFPVRIKVEDPDESFRVGASAVATVSRNAPPRGSVTSWPRG